MFVALISVEEEPSGFYDYKRAQRLLKAQQLGHFKVTETPHLENRWETGITSAAEEFSGVEVKLSSSAYLEVTISGEAAGRAARTKLSHESPRHVPPRQSLGKTAFFL